MPHVDMADGSANLSATDDCFKTPAREKSSTEDDKDLDEGGDGEARELMEAIWRMYGEVIPNVDCSEI